MNPLRWHLTGWAARQLATHTLVRLYHVIDNEIKRRWETP